MDPIPIEYRSVIRYNREWQVIICLQCDGHAAIGRSQLKRHLHASHGFSGKDYKPLIKALDSSNVPILQCLDDFPRPMNDSAPIEDLRINNGLKCNQCGFLSTSQHIMRRHIRDEKQKILTDNPSNRS